MKGPSPACSLYQEDNASLHFQLPFLFILRGSDLFLRRLFLLSMFNPLPILSRFSLLGLEVWTFCESYPFVLANWGTYPLFFRFLESAIAFKARWANVCQRTWCLIVAIEVELGTWCPVGDRLDDSIMITIFPLIANIIQHYLQIPYWFELNCLPWAWICEDSSEVFQLDKATQAIFA